MTQGILAKFAPPKTCVHGIETLSLGDFTLGDKLDQQDALVCALQKKVENDVDNPSVEVALQLRKWEGWMHGINEENQSLWDMKVIVFVDPSCQQIKNPGLKVCTYHKEGPQWQFHWKEGKIGGTGIHTS